MRLFRRTLLCLVVGVTAFGVAGWGFRPKANWSVSLGAAKGASFGEKPASHRDGGPVWVAVRLENEYSRAERWACLDAKTGAVLKSVSTPPGLVRSAGVTDDGRLLVVSTPKTPANAVETLIEFHDHEHASPVFSRRHFGDCLLFPNGRTAWQVHETPSGFTLKVEDFDGHSVVTKSFPDGRYLIGDWTLTNDLRFALYFGEPKKSPVPTGVEIWDLKRDALVASADFPPLAHLSKTVYLSPPRFDDEESVIAMDVWSQDLGHKLLRTLVFDPRTGTLSNHAVEIISDPPNAGQGTVIAAQPSSDRYQIWISEQSDPPSLWWCIQRDGKVIAPWRRWPFARNDRPFFGVHGYPRIRVSTRPSMFDAPNQLLFESYEPAPAQLIPTAFRRWVPKWLEMPWTIRRIRWHDWTTDEWRDVGVESNRGELSWSRDASFIAAIEGSQLVVESWPLPPRDPKWPAFGVAALCAAGMWWACAKRYRRRVNRTSISLVTA